MHILELNFEKGWRGGERQVLYCIQGLKQACHQATLLCRKGSELAGRAMAEGVDVVECDGVIEVVKYLYKYAKNFDILHCHTSNMLTYCIATKWKHKRPVVLSRRVSYEPKGYFTLLKYRLTNKVIAISNAVKDILHSRGIQRVSVISDIAVPLEL